MKHTDLSEFEQKLLYRFNNIDILNQALCHSSFVNEQIAADMQDNECLEFLGDAVLNLVVGHILIQRYKDLKEGDLSRMRANLVNESRLATIARTIDIGSYIRLGKGEIQTDGRKKESILADTFEAVIAAVYIDGGFAAAFKIIDDHFSILLNSIDAPTQGYDYKSQIQELVQVDQGRKPLYNILNESGPNHNKTFTVQLKVDRLQAEGVGKSKKMAEQDAARKALEILKKMTDDS